MSALEAAKALGDHIWKTLWPNGDDTAPPSVEGLPEIADAVDEWKADGGPESLRGDAQRRLGAGR